jgi:hypothetical protein
MLKNNKIIKGYYLNLKEFLDYHFKDYCIYIFKDIIYTELSSKDSENVDYMKVFKSGSFSINWWELEQLIAPPKKSLHKILEDGFSKINENLEKSNETLKDGFEKSNKYLQNLSLK